jgi:hypothetical protein
VTSVAKQRDPAAQSKRFGNVDWEMKLSAYQNEGVRSLAAVTAIAWCEEKHLTTMATHLPENEGGALQAQMAWWLGSNDTAPHVNLKKKKRKLWKRISVDGWGLSNNQMCEFRVLIIPYVLNVPSSVNKIFMWELLFSHEPVAKLYTCNLISWFKSLGSLHAKRVQTKVVKVSQHLYSASNKSNRYPSEASSWSALNNFQYVILQIDTAS